MLHFKKYEIALLKLTAGSVMLAFLSACGGGGGGGAGGVVAQTPLPITTNTATGSTLISAAGGIVAVNGITVVELSAGASTSPATVTALLRPSTTGGLTDEVVVDLSATVPSDTTASQVSVYFYPTSVKQVAASASKKANEPAVSGAEALNIAPPVPSLTFAGSTVAYTQDQLEVVGTIGTILLRARQPVWDSAKGAFKATFTAASAAATTVKAISGSARKFIVNVKVKDNDNTARLYHFPNLASVGTEAVSVTAETKIPLVLVHGIQLLSEGCGANNAYKGTWDKFRAHFFGDSEMPSKYELYSFSYPTNIDFKTNGASFSKKLSTVFGNKPVVVVAHSMGGLVTRAADVYYSTKAQSGNITDINIARVITLDTPHHGTPYISGAAAEVTELFCLGDVQNAGAPSLAWDDLENNRSCTDSGNPVLCELNSPQNLQHLKKYVPYSAHGVLGTFVSYAGTNVNEYPWLLHSFMNSVVLLGKVFSQTVIDNYFSSEVAKKSDIAVLLPSQRLMSHVNNQWVDNPSLFADLPDAYSSTYHIDIGESNPGVAGSAKVWSKKADGTPGGVRGHLNEFAFQITGKPDLIPSAVTTTPASVQPGASINVSWRITNSGNANAAASTTGLRLVSAATSGNGTSANNLLNVSTVALAPGGASNQSQAVTIPVGTVPGTYVIVVVADNAANTTVNQSNINNDFARSPVITISESIGDTTPSALTCTSVINEVVGRSPNGFHVFLAVGSNSTCKSNTCVEGEITKLRSMGLNAFVNPYSLQAGGYNGQMQDNLVPGCVGIRPDIATEYGFTSSIDLKKISDAAKCVAAKLGSSYRDVNSLVNSEHPSCTADGSLFPIVVK
jgi:pimeloyl-ACP methyl ester carboxylesterase/predicted RNase H-related nuclease YkuK (DUF458 family)